MVRSRTAAGALNDCGRLGALLDRCVEHLEGRGLRVGPEPSWICFPEFLERFARFGTCRFCDRPRVFLFCSVLCICFCLWSFGIRLFDRYCTVTFAVTVALLAFGVRRVGNIALVLPCVPVVRVQAAIVVVDQLGGYQLFDGRLKLVGLNAE